MQNKVVTLKVSGIHCNGCAAKIKNSVLSIDQSFQTEVVVDSGDVTVSYDSTKASLSEIKSKIESVGFSIESVRLE